MKKSIVSIILVLFTILSFVGCGNISYEDNDNSDNNEGTTDVNLKEGSEESDDNANYVLFGTYEQDGNLGNGTEPIQWVPLFEQDGNVLLISRYILDYKEFNDTTIASATSWENSTLRKWLNGDFLNSAFSSSEKNRIVTTTVQDYKADNVLGETTSDKVFLLNKDQIFTYFASDSARATTSTAYAKTQKTYVTNAYWLINSYSSDLYKYLINAEGRNENNPRVNESEGIRPVIWISKEG